MVETGRRHVQVTQVFEEYMERKGTANDNAEVVRSQAQRIMSQRQTVRPLPFSPRSYLVCITNDQVYYVVLQRLTRN